MMGLWKNLLHEEDGLGTVEIVIIVAVLVGLALIFRNYIYKFVTLIFEKIFKDAGAVVDKPTQAPPAKLGN